jgi:hypothetical protein
MNSGVEQKQGRLGLFGARHLQHIPILGALVVHIEFLCSD